MDSCKELSSIAAELFVLVWVVISVAIFKFLVFLAKPKGESLSRASRSTGNDVQNEDDPNFTWRGHEAEQAYREKHWGSYRELRRAQQDAREAEIRRDERSRK